MTAQSLSYYSMPPTSSSDAAACLRLPTSSALYLHLSFSLPFSLPFSLGWVFFGFHERCMCFTFVHILGCSLFCSFNIIFNKKKMSTSLIILRVASVSSCLIMRWYGYFSLTTGSALDFPVRWCAGPGFHVWRAVLMLDGSLSCLPRLHQLAVDQVPSEHAAKQQRFVCRGEVDLYGHAITWQEVKRFCLGIEKKRRLNVRVPGEWEGERGGGWG